MPTKVIHITQYTDFEEDLDKLFVEGYEVKAIVPEGRTTCGMIVLYKPPTPTFEEMLAALSEGKCESLVCKDALVRREYPIGSPWGIPHTATGDELIFTYGSLRCYKGTNDWAEIINLMKEVGGTPSKWTMVTT